MSPPLVTRMSHSPAEAGFPWSLPDALSSSPQGSLLVSPFPLSFPFIHSHGLMVLTLFSEPHSIIYLFLMFKWSPVWPMAAHQCQSISLLRDTKCSGLTLYSPQVTLRSAFTQEALVAFGGEWDSEAPLRAGHAPGSWGVAARRLSGDPESKGTHPHTQYSPPQSLLRPSTHS